MVLIPSGLCSSLQRQRSCGCSRKVVVFCTNFLGLLKCSLGGSLRSNKPYLGLRLPNPFLKCVWGALRKRVPDCSMETATCRVMSHAVCKECDYDLCPALSFLQTVVTCCENSVKSMLNIFEAVALQDVVGETLRCSFHHESHQKYHC